MRHDRRRAAAVISAKLGAVAITVMVAMLLATPAFSSVTPTPTVGGGARSWQPEWAAERVYVPLAGVSYEAAGGERAVNAFLENDPTVYHAAKGGVPAGVGYAVSEMPLTLAQINSYTRAATNGPLIELPLAVIPVTIPVVTAPTSSTVTLSDDDLCGIFSGRFTDWSQVTNPDTGGYYPAAGLTVVYRSDASGDTDLLTRHLSQVCVPSITHPVGTPNSSVVFSETATLASAFPSGVPGNFVAASSPQGMRDTLSALRNAKRAAIGYLTPAYTNLTLAPLSDQAQANLPVAMLRNAYDSHDYLPDSVSVAQAVRGSNAHPPLPREADQPALWPPGTADPASGYPLTGTINLIFAQCFSSGQAAHAWANALKMHFEDPGAVRLLNGYGAASLPADYVAAIDNDFLSHVAGVKVDLGNATVCDGQKD